MRIERIEIKDFRGFPAAYEFKLGKPGRSLLIYGENGSGKSSLFQALKGFFAAAESNNPIAQYGNSFLPAPEPLVRLDIVGYETDGSRSTDSAIFEWSTTSSPVGQALIQQAGKLHSCLDYRDLLETHYIHRERDHADVFTLLANVILTHSQNPISGLSFKEEIEGIRKDRTQPFRNPHKTRFLERIKIFNQGFADAVERLVKKANELIADFFSDTEIQLSIDRSLVFIAAGKGKYLENPKVLVTTRFCGRDIPNPHQFLNEARLSALAICLYLSSLLIVPATKIRLLVLDDLLIGIDMSNRMAVLKALRKHFSEWQIILMTLDRVWFDTVHIYTKSENKWWYGELYAEKAPDNTPLPLWKGNGDGWTHSLERAREHLASHDDRAAAVYARAAFEGKLKKYCDKNGVPVQYKSDSSKMKSEMFWIAIKKRLTDAKTIATYQQQIDEVEVYRNTVLNPLSHEHPITLTTAEIRGAIDAIAELDKVLT